MNWGIVNVEFEREKFEKYPPDPEEIKEVVGNITERMQTMLRKGLKIKTPPKKTEKELQQEADAQLAKEIKEAKEACLM